MARQNSGAPVATKESYLRPRPFPIPIPLRCLSAVPTADWIIGRNPVFTTEQCLSPIFSPVSFVSHLSWGFTGDLAGARELPSPL